MKPLVLGIDLDEQTRCAHYHSSWDIVAIKMKCCGQFYACIQCHNALADHPVQRWHRKEYDSLSILCGSCHQVLTIRTYRHADRCPHCAALFNPRCALHYPLYFDD